MVSLIPGHTYGFILDFVFKIEYDHKKEVIIVISCLSIKVDYSLFLKILGQQLKFELTVKFYDASIMNAFLGKM